MLIHQESSGSDLRFSACLAASHWQKASVEPPPPPPPPQHNMALPQLKTGGLQTEADDSVTVI